MQIARIALYSLFLACTGVAFDAAGQSGRPVATPPTAEAAGELPPACRDKPVPSPFDAQAYPLDGNTVAVLGGGPHIRLWGIQAPELRDKDRQETVPGMRARAALDALLLTGAHKVRIAPAKWDRQCRLVAIVTVTPEIPMSHPGTEGARTPTPLVAVDAGLTMLFKGFAYGFSLDDAISGQPGLNESYAQAEASARKRLEGLWPIWLGIAKETLPRP
jgi:endonuclease YncB( thermonuclease family)